MTHSYPLRAMISAALLSASCIHEPMLVPPWASVERSLVIPARRSTDSPFSTAPMKLSARRVVAIDSDFADLSQVIDELFCGFAFHLSTRLGGVGAHVGGHHHIVEILERSRVRLDFEAVECGTGQMARDE